LASADPVTTCGGKGPDDTPWADYSLGRGSARIVNGQTATECEWKWQVSLASGYHFCGGTLIDPNWVLTAAHCIDPYGSPFKIVLGHHSIYYDDSDSDAYQVEAEVEEVYSHGDYDEWTMQNDIALVKLTEAVVLNECIGTACLLSGYPAAGDECFITGWGTTSSGGSTPTHMQEAKVTILSTFPEHDGGGGDECGVYYSGTITEDMLCANGVNSDGEVTDGCQGDSGGPLVCTSDGTTYAIHGATSWGMGCADPEYPGLWSKVYVYVENGWIDAVMAGNITAGDGGDDDECADDDAQAIEYALYDTHTVTGCADLQAYCEDPLYAGMMIGTCPATCGLCSAMDCVGDSSSWDSGFGGCDTYAPGMANDGYCTSDASPDGVLAIYACSECGSCSAVEEDEDCSCDTDVDGEGVCADNEVWYPNSCEAMCAGLTFWSDGYCGDVSGVSPRGLALLFSLRLAALLQ
jgi:hypothetical protein